MPHGESDLAPALERITPFFAYPAEIRKVIYTTNAVESLHMSLRKIIKMRGLFPDDEAALKLLYLALRNAAKKWTMPIQNWNAAMNRFSILWPDRMPAGERVLKTRARLARQNSGESCQNGGAVESLETNTRLSTAPLEISPNRRFPHFHCSGGGCFYLSDRRSIEQQKLKPFTQKS